MNNALAVTYVSFPSGDFSSARPKIFLPSTLSTHDSTRAVEPSGSRLYKKNIELDYNDEITKLYTTVPVRFLISLDLFINMIISSLTFFQYISFLFLSNLSVWSSTHSNNGTSRKKVHCNSFFSWGRIIYYRHQFGRSCGLAVNALNSRSAVWV